MTCIRPYSYVVVRRHLAGAGRLPRDRGPGARRHPRERVAALDEPRRPCKVTVNGTPAIASPARFTTFTEMEPLRKASASVRSTVVPAGVLPAD